MLEIPGDCPGEEGGLGWEEEDDLPGEKRRGVFEIAVVNLRDFPKETPAAGAVRGRLPPGGGGRGERRGSRARACAGRGGVRPGAPGAPALMAPLVAWREAH